MKGIVAGATRVGGPDGEAAWTINVTKNRLDPSTFRPAAFDAMMQKLAELVPMMRDPSRLMQVPYVAAAVNDAAKAIVTKAGSSLGGHPKPGHTSTGQNRPLRSRGT